MSLSLPVLRCQASRYSRTRKPPTGRPASPRRAGPWLALLLALTSVAAPAAEPELRLDQALARAWSQQPQARALAAQREAAEADGRVARALLPEAPRLELDPRLDLRGPERGLRELELGLVLPLWRRGEQAAGRDLAEARRQTVEREAEAARLALAGSLRMRWWARLLAELEAELAQAQLALAQRLVEDVDRRVQAGELARADAHQARMAEAAARAAAARAAGAVQIARQQLAALLGADAGQPLKAEPEAAPPADAAPTGVDGTAHPALRLLAQQLEAAERQLALQARQGQGTPELRLLALRERGASGEASRSALRLGLSLPLGESPQQDARRAQARAEVESLRAQWDRRRSELAAEQAEAHARVQALAAEQAAAEQRAALAEETAGFLRRAFELGELDLPSRLRIEAEAASARRETARLRLEQAAARSAWRQALGLLP